MKILVISLAGIGDTLMATPLIHELGANFPDATIDALVKEAASRDVLTGNPHLNQVHQKNLIKAGPIASFKFLWGLRKYRYDVSLNTHPQTRAVYRLAARVAGARQRFSHRYHSSGMLDRLLVSRTIPQDYNIHCVENNLALLPLCGAKVLLPTHDYEFFLTDTERQWAKEYVSNSNLGARVRLGIHVGSGSTKNLALRRWPIENYIALIKKLSHSRPDIAVLLFGGPDEEKDHAQILEQIPSGSVFAPRTADLRQAAALVGQCNLFLSVDTVFMHIAAAMKVPRQVVIETPTFNKTVEPWHQQFVTVKNPVVAGCHLDYYRYDGRDIRGTPEELKRCMASVSVDAVYNAITG
jgi:ADP-heptose:LPS heptosyltransferase